LRENLGTKWSVCDAGLSALLVDLIDNLGSNFVPQPACARRGERLDLKSGTCVIEANGDDLFGTFFHFEPQLEIGPGNNLDAT
jgi:hypothetical protein